MTSKQEHVLELWYSDDETNHVLAKTFLANSLVSGFGFIYGNGYGNGNGDGNGYGNGYGDGNGYGYGNGNGYGDGNGYGNGNGKGYGDGNGNGNGDGDGDGDGNGNGNGDGDGNKDSIKQLYFKTSKQNMEGSICIVTRSNGAYTFDYIALVVEETEQHVKLEACMNIRYWGNGKGKGYIAIEPLYETTLDWEGTRTLSKIGGGEIDFMAMTKAAQAEYKEYYNSKCKELGVEPYNFPS